MSEEFYKRRSRFYYAFLLTFFDNDRDKLQQALNKFSDKGRELRKQKEAEEKKEDTKDVEIEEKEEKKEKSTKKQSKKSSSE